MKRFLVALFLFVPFSASAQFFYADTALTAPGQCGIFLDSAPKVTAPTVLVGSVHTCKYDVANVSNGSHSIKATAIGVNDPTYANQESGQSVPFAFSKLGSPINPRIGP